MFNLPFPTDSLYKFCFMFGLVLIVFSLYFREKELNKYDNSQAFHKVDSLTKEIEKNKDASDWFYETSKDLLKESEVYLYKEPKNVKVFMKLMHHYFTDVTFNTDNKVILGHLRKLYLDTTDIEDIKLNLRSLQLSCIEDYGNKNESLNESLKIYQGSIDKYSSDFIYLLSVGIVLFLTGTLSWYFNIQRPQDKLLRIQLLEAEKKHSDQLISYRKHFEPKVLPRPEVRNRV